MIKDVLSCWVILFIQSRPVTFPQVAMAAVLDTKPSIQRRMMMGESR
jgi:hypothetical protein